MTHSNTARWSLAFVIAAGLALAATPSWAGISADLAKQCRTMMVQAHPTVMFSANGSAAAQRAYFHECISRQGRMNDHNIGVSGGEGPMTTGSGSYGTTPSGRRY